MTEEEATSVRRFLVGELCERMAGLGTEEIALMAAKFVAELDKSLNQWMTATLLFEAHRRSVLMEAAGVIRNNQILHTSEGGVLRPRGEGNIESLAYAEELERMAT